MNNLRAKKVRHAMTLIARQYGDNVMQACQDKLAMPNRHGDSQHRTISPKRQLKKMVLRTKIS